LRDAIRNNQPMKESAQTDAIIEDLRKQLKLDKESIKHINDRNTQLSKDLESANQFREELKDKDQGRQMTELINTNEELARRLQKMSRDLTS
jgi:DNA-binding ferritin-like protein